MSFSGSSSNLPSNSPFSEKELGHRLYRLNCWPPFGQDVKGMPKEFSPLYAIQVRIPMCVYMTATRRTEADPVLKTTKPRD